MKQTQIILHAHKLVLSCARVKIKEMIAKKEESHSSLNRFKLCNRFVHF